MAKRNVIWTKTADLQLVGVLEYWVNRNKSNTYAKKLMKLVTERTEVIAKNPFIFKKTTFKDNRVSTLGNFSIFYKISNNIIIVTAF